MSGIMIGGHNSSNPALNYGNTQVFSGGNEIESEMASQLNINQLKEKSPDLNDFDNCGEDIIMMNIPREGNAEQLNKSTKLTLSSKKQYDHNNAYINLNISQQSQPNSATLIPNNINLAAMNVTRSKMNSTMMVKFGSNPDNAILNQRQNMNKSTLLPSNINSSSQN